jgi:hypothetical protein
MNALGIQPPVFRNPLVQMRRPAEATGSQSGRPKAWPNIQPQPPYDKQCCQIFSTHRAACTRGIYPPKTFPDCVISFPDSWLRVCIENGGEPSIDGFSYGCKIQLDLAQADGHSECPLGEERRKSFPRLCTRLHQSNVIKYCTQLNIGEFDAILYQQTGGPQSIREQWVN